MKEPPNGFTRIIANIPDDLHRRAKLLSKKIKLPMVYMLRDSLAERCAIIEDEIRKKEAEREAEELQRKRGIGRGRPPLSRPNGPYTPSVHSLMSKKAEELTEAVEEESDLPLLTQLRRGIRPDVVDSLDKLYEEHAKRILAAGNDEKLVRQRATEALTAIKKDRPLTHPPEERILARIEEKILKMREESVVPELRTYDNFVGTVLDVSKLKTQGGAG